MSFQLYKEGQGTWARGLLASVVGVAGIFAAVHLHGYLEAEGYVEGTFQLWPFGWQVGWREVIAVIVTLPFAAIGIWLYNRPKVADFLIETEGELATKVTWPTRKETVNNSIVVLVMCILLAIWVTLADFMFRSLREVIY